MIIYKQIFHNMHDLLHKKLNLLFEGSEAEYTVWSSYENSPTFPLHYQILEKSLFC